MYFGVVGEVGMCMCEARVVVVSSTPPILGTPAMLSTSQFV